jgi:hypothetical protein
VPARPLDLGSTDARADDAVALDTAVEPDATPADLGTAPADAGTAPVDAERPVEPPRGETPLPPLPGGPRQELGVAALGARIHVLGGLDAEERPLARHEVYDTSRGAWAVARDLPVPVNHPNAAAGPDGRLWVLGFLGRRAVPDRRGFVYDPAAGNKRKLKEALSIPDLLDLDTLTGCVGGRVRDGGMGRGEGIKVSAATSSSSTTTVTMTTTKVSSSSSSLATEVTIR